MRPGYAGLGASMRRVRNTGAARNAAKKNKIQAIKKPFRCERVSF